MKSLNRIWIWLLLAILASSCERGFTNPSTLTPEIGIPTVPVTTNVQKPTLTITPRARLTPTRTLYSTVEPSLEPTPIAISTLSAREATVQLHELLKSNGNCRLPCLWGITPGMSNFREAQEVLSPLGSISGWINSFVPGIGTIDLNYSGDDIDLDFDVSLLVSDDDIVKRINFGARAFRELEEQRESKHVFDSEYFDEQIYLYTLAGILTQYGPPESVFVSTLAEPLPEYRGIVFFNILLLYPDLGTILHYSTDLRVVGDDVIGCPSGAHVEMDLLPSGNRDSFQEFLSQSWEKNIRDNYKPLDEATSLSVTEFFQTFRQQTDVCLETPSSLWPIPEK